MDTGLHDLIQTASNALGPVVLLFVARNVKAATEALNISNQHSAEANKLNDAIQKQYDKVKKDLDELWARVRLAEADKRKGEPQ